MVHGDISNHQSYVIGFRCENSLLKYKDKSFIDLIANSLAGKTKRAEINKDIYSLMKYIYSNTEYTVALIIDESNYTKEAKEYLSDFPFNNVATIIRSRSEITSMLNTGYLTYYVTDDILDKQLVNSIYAVDSKTFNAILKRGVKRVL